MSFLCRHHIEDNPSTSEPPQLTEVGSGFDSERAGWETLGWDCAAACVTAGRKATEEHPAQRFEVMSDSHPAGADVERVVDIVEGTPS